MKRGLWRNNRATESQQQLVFVPHRKRPVKVTQADVLTALLRRARSEDRALDLPEILQTRIAQYPARIFELRERGFVIENELERTGNGAISRYWLRHDPERDGAE